MPPKKLGSHQHHYTCGICSTIINERTEPSILCSGCRTWIHSKCTGLTPDEYKILARSIKKDGVIWKCATCKFEVSVITQEDLMSDDADDTVTMDKLEQLFNNQFNRLSQKLEAKIDRFKAAIEDNIADLRNDVTKIAKQNTSLTDTCARLNNRLTTVENKLTSYTVNSTSPEEVFAEFNERKRRESNVVVLNVMESKKASGNDRLDEDRTQISAILPPNLSTSIDNLKLRRLGRPIAGRSRPLLIETPSPTIALTILKSKPPTTVDGTQIAFKSDLTPAQLLHLKNLRTQLDTLEKNGDTNKTIKYINGTPKIVNKNFRSLSKDRKTLSNKSVVSERQRPEDKINQISDRYGDQ